MHPKFMIWKFFSALGLGAGEREPLIQQGNASLLRFSQSRHVRAYPTESIATFYSPMESPAGQLWFSYSRNQVSHPLIARTMHSYVWNSKMLVYYQSVIIFSDDDDRLSFCNLFFQIICYRKWGDQVGYSIILLKNLHNSKIPMRVLAIKAGTCMLLLIWMIASDFINALKRFLYSRYLDMNALFFCVGSDDEEEMPYRKQRYSSKGKSGFSEQASSFRWKCLITCWESVMMQCLLWDQEREWREQGDKTLESGWAVMKRNDWCLEDTSSIGDTVQSLNLPGSRKAYRITVWMHSLLLLSPLLIAIY